MIQVGRCGKDHLWYGKDPLCPMWYGKDPLCPMWCGKDHLCPMWCGKDHLCPLRRSLPVTRPPDGYARVGGVDGGGCRAKDCRPGLADGGGGRRRRCGGLVVERKAFAADFVVSPSSGERSRRRVPTEHPADHDGHASSGSPRVLRLFPRHVAEPGFVRAAGDRVRSSRLADGHNVSDAPVHHDGRASA